MNGRAPDSNSLEMRAMSAYIRWVGKDVEKGKKPTGTGLEPLVFIERAADPARGKTLYTKKCQSCHGENGKASQTACLTVIFTRHYGVNTVIIPRQVYIVSPNSPLL